MARKERVVVAKRGCTCCGTGCVIPAAIMPTLAFSLSGALGALVAVLLSLPITLALLHSIAWKGRRGPAG